MDLADRRSEIERQLSALGDYIWKLPNFIEHERAREIRVLDEYFPATDDPDQAQMHRFARRLRIEHEFTRLDNDFPDFMASSAIIHVVSLFEYHLLGVCQAFEQHGASSLDEFRGKRQGAARLLSYAQSVAEKALPHEGIDIMRKAIVLRNCMAHANGILSEFAEAARLREWIRLRSCYRPKGVGGLPDHRRNEPHIVDTALGEQLIVPLSYSHWLTYTCRDVLVALCGAIGPADRQPS